MEISLNNLHFFARHGVMAQEREVGQNYEVDVTLRLPDSQAVGALLNDNLESTVNYAEAVEEVRREMSVPSALLEHVALRIARTLLARFRKVERVDVKLTKCCPPIAGFDGAGASVSFSLRRQLVVLDFDGTLADTSRGIVRTMTATFQQCGYAVPSDEAICRTIGLPLTQSIAQLAGIEGEELVKAVDTYRELFETIGNKGVTLFPEVKETLHTLHEMGVTLCIATSRGHESVKSMCRELGILPYMSHIVACEDVEKAKPNPEAVLTLLKKTDMTPAQTWVIGDTTFDVGMGQGAQCRTIGVTYGNHSREELLRVGTTNVIDKFSEVLDCVM